jgi:cytidylate kinase
VAAITISRQVSSRGDDLASQVAQRLGWRTISRELINKAALAAGAPQVALAEIDELDFLGLRPSPREWRAYRDQVEGIIQVLAEVGNIVIVGRGGQIVLQDWPEALHVRVVAPLEKRIAWLQAGENLSPQVAEARLLQSDKRRTSYLRRSYKINPDDPTLYHLMVNTGCFNLTQAVELVIQAFETLTTRKTEL